MKRLCLIAAVAILPVLCAPTRTRGNASVGYAQTTESAHALEKRDAKITAQPNPLADLKGASASVQKERKIVLRMVLRANGKVTDISVVRSDAPELNKVAVQAAKKIKFAPAMKDGQPVSQWATVTYTFRVDAEDKK